MFFILSKIGWSIFQPSTFLIAGSFLGTCLLLTPFARLGRLLVCCFFTVLAICALTPLGVLFIRPLEERFPKFSSDKMRDAVGIIVLGGDPARIIEAVGLARCLQDAQLIFSGGSGNLLGSDLAEADAAKAFSEKLGLPPNRAIVERMSRNTFENAAFSYQLVGPRASERWVLVTTASHMPRAVAAFAKAGFSVVPYPVGRLTTGDFRDYWNYTFTPNAALYLVDAAVKEWIGLIVYWLMGRTLVLFPGPESITRSVDPISLFLDPADNVDHLDACHQRMLRHVRLRAMRLERIE